MSKFHVHPVTGVVSQCHSTKGKCPFGGESGVENHYSTREEALANFEKLMKSSTIATLKKSNKIVDKEFPVGEVRVVLKDFIERVAKSNPEAAYAINAFLNNLEGSPLPNTVRDLNKEMLKRLPVGNGGLRQALNFNNALYKAYEKYSLEVSGLKMNYTDLTNYSADRERILERIDHSKKSGSDSLVQLNERYLKKLEEDYEKLKDRFGERSFDEVVKEEALPQFLDEAEKLSKRKISKNNNFMEDGEKIETDGHRITYVSDGESLKRIIKDSPDSSVYNGVISAEDHVVKAEELSKIGEGLAKTFVKNDGGMMARDQFNLPPAFMNRDKNGVTAGLVAGAEDFSLIGGGNESNAYLHEPTGMVYKVYHNASFRRVHAFGEKGKIEKMTAIVNQVEGEYGELDRESLKEYNMEYLPTYFITSKDGNGNDVPMVVQPYLDQELHVPVSGEYIDPNIAEKMGINDLYADNIRMNILTKKIILFDCIL